tara:strand:+ start:473 stop:1405 length:933 start_codon:yes stop_codon:yes gene_type:complete
MEDRLLALLESVLGVSKKTSGDNYAFYSPFVEHYKPKLEINIKLNSNGKNPWHCWVSDAKGTTIHTLLKQLRVSKDIWDEHNSIFKRTYRYKTDSTTEQSEVVQLPTEYIPLWKPSTAIGRKHALNYLNRRGVSSSEVVKYQIGYCEEGEFKNKVIVPSYNSDGRLNFFVGRSFYDTAYKHKNPDVSKDIVGFDMLVNWELPIVICEGVFDAMAIRMNAIPLFGKSPQSELIKKILSKNVKTIYIALDKDAFTSALRFAKTLMDEGIDVYVIEMNESDPSDMGFDEFYKLMNNTKQLTLMKLMEYKLMNV